MKNFFKHIPGFRSDRTWKKVIAILYYIFSFAMLLSGDIGLFISFLGIPFLTFSLVDLTKAKKNNKPMKAAATTLIISLIATSVGFAMIEPEENDVAEKETPAAVEKVEEKTEEIKTKPEKPKEPEKPKKEQFEKVRDLKVHYIDVGQGDSILVQLPNGETALIDGGPESSSQTVVNYLKEQNVEKIDYLVATHPHEDHIGGLPIVIQNFEIGNIYMPDKTHTTKTFENLILAIQNKGIKFKTPIAGDMLLDKEGLNLTVLAPETNINEDNLNNYSIVLKLNYKDNSFLFTGDAETESEQNMLNGSYDLKSDVLKVGHHGSYSSTTNEFLEKINPEYAIISCGVENKYGYPHQAIIDKLEAKGIQIYRTDKDGTIIIAVDNEEIKIDFKKTAEPNKENAPPKEEKQSSYKNSQPNQSVNSNGESNKNSSNSGNTSSNGAVSKPKPPATDGVEEVYITNTGSKYHRGNCRHLKKSKIPISLKKAKSQGFTPCKVCGPPQ